MNIYVKSIDPQYLWIHFPEEVDPSEFISHIPTFQPRNLEQRLAWRNLTNQDLEVNFLTGGSGSGKTVLAYAAAFERILGNEKLRNEGKIPEGIVIFKTNDIIGGKDRQFGFLRDSLDEKTKMPILTTNNIIGFENHYS